jgi:alcohol dehydrogenase
MQALVYSGPGKKALEEHAKPEVIAPTDAIVKVGKTTICGTDLHILKGTFGQAARTRALKVIIEA